MANQYKYQKKAGLIGNRGTNQLAQNFRNCRYYPLPQLREKMGTQNRSSELNNSTGKATLFQTMAREKWKKLGGRGTHL